VLILKKRRVLLASQKLNREDYRVDKYWVLLAVVKEYAPLKLENDKHCCVHKTNLAG